MTGHHSWFVERAFHTLRLHYAGRFEVVWIPRVDSGVDLQLIRCV